MWYPEGYERSLSMLFNQCTVEALRMCWLKSDRWKAGIALAGMLLLLMLMVWIPVSAAGADERASGLATPGTGTVQATPTEDATVTVLKKEQLTQQVRQLDNWWLYWLYNGSTAFIAAFATLAVAGFGLYQWRGNRNAEREKEKDAQDKELRDRAEERFKTAVTALGDEKESVQVGGAILLRSFLHEEDKKSYGRYYPQIFDLAVAYLRLPRTSPPSEDPDGISPLRQALIVVFKEAFPLARGQTKGLEPESACQALDARKIQLARAYLYRADLKQVFLPQAFLYNANLTGANLTDADLFGAHLDYAHFKGARLEHAILEQAWLTKANLTRANLTRANLTGANLTDADLEYANLTKANPQNAASLEGAKMYYVIGLSSEQRKACKAKGAIVDEDTTTSPPQSPVSPPAPSQSNDAQAQSAPPIQSIPTPDTDGSCTTSSKPDPES
jgi:hypothetical protein